MSDLVVSDRVPVQSWLRSVLLLQATLRTHGTRCWYGLRATALQPTVGVRGHGHSHPSARCKGVTKSLDLALAFSPAESRARGTYLDRAVSMKSSATNAISLGLAVINEGSI